jgi:hypothetical protein
VWKLKRACAPLIARASDYNLAPAGLPLHVLRIRQRDGVEGIHERELAAVEDAVFDPVRGDDATGELAQAGVGPSIVTGLGMQEEDVGDGGIWRRLAGVVLRRPE